MFDQYDSIKAMDTQDNISQLLAFGKKQDILDKIYFIQKHLKNSTQINIINLSFHIQDLFKRRHINNEEEKEKIINKEENKYSQYNDVKENLFNILSKEEINNEQKNNNELIKMEKDSDNNKMEIEPNSTTKKEKEEIPANLIINKPQEEKKEEQFTGKKRTRDKKKKDKEKDKDKDDNKKKNKKRKINNKENENNNINNVTKGVKKEKEKEENIKKKKTKKDSKQNTKNRSNTIKDILTLNFSTKTENNRRKNTNQRKPKKKEDTKRTIRTPKKPTDMRKSNMLIEEILKRQYELGNKLTKQKDPNKNKDIPQTKEKETKEDKSDINNNNTNNINSILNSNIKPKYQRPKKKGKKINNTSLIIDEELKKSTPIRNLKKQPKSILKKINLNQQPQTPIPIKFQKARSSEKKINLSSSNKKFKTFAEIFQSPSKLKATPLKRRVNSEKKSNIKMNSILTVEEKSEKKEGKKRNISFNNERIVKEYNPKTPVRDVKQRITRKSPLERKNRNELIKQ